MIVIGLTGSIGMGKTTVAALCRDLGIATDNADAVVHGLLSPAGEAFADVANAFPQAVKDGAIDRAALGRIVFGDRQKLALLESIIHPLVAKERALFLARAREEGQPMVVLDIPLLFEKNLASQVDVVLTVSASEAVQRARVLARPGMSVETYENILAQQMPDAEKRRRSDYIITTDGTREDTLKQLRAILERIDSSHAPDRS